MSEVNLANAGLDVESEAPPPQKGGKLIKGIIVVAVVIAIEVVVAIVVVKKYVVPVNNAPQGTAAAAAATVHSNNPVGEATEGGSIYEISGLVVNPAGTQGTRYLSATVGLETFDGHLIEELETKDALVRDTLIDILSSKRIANLNGPAAKDSLRQEIITNLNTKLLNGTITRVYFTNYVIQ